MSILEICKMIQDSQIGSGIRESNYFFPVMEGIHVLGIAVSVGTILWFDLRLIGVNMRDQKASEVFEEVEPWMLGGFITMLVTGVLLFLAHAALIYVNTFFRIKMAALTFSALNALYFHLKIQKGIDDWDSSPTLPLKVRMVGLLSIVLWFTVIAAGRLMAYTFAINEF